MFFMGIVEIVRCWLVTAGKKMATNEDVIEVLKRFNWLLGGNDGSLFIYDSEQHMIDVVSEFRLYFDKLTKQQLVSSLPKDDNTLISITSKLGEFIAGYPCYFFSTADYLAHTKNQSSYCGITTKPIPPEPKVCYMGGQIKGCEVFGKSPEEVVHRYLTKSEKEVLLTVFLAEQALAKDPNNYVLQEVVRATWKKLPSSNVFDKE